MIFFSSRAKSKSGLQLASHSLPLANRSMKKTWAAAAAAEAEEGQAHWSGPAGTGRLTDSRKQSRMAMHTTLSMLTAPVYRASQSTCLVLGKRDPVKPTRKTA